MSSVSGTAPAPVALEATEGVPGRPFTAVDVVERDLAILYELLDDVGRYLREVAEGSMAVVPYREVSWQVDGRLRRHIVCDVERLLPHPRLCVVGFFGDLRDGVDATPLEEANTAVVAEFAKYPGILSYSSMELAGGNWANMVLHDDPVDTEYWRRSEKHARAVKLLSRPHYRTVRIYNAELTEGVLAGPTIAPKTVKYFDYTGESDWKAVRPLE